ncbi:hypothetical protein TVAG_407120 [Trichomonas vaginalis G3]|uniref:Uncharacterized protein n=1 Tax=Trichomonas vaginalis (strain ATCC PRA-98 / G3) TaxID=412133 RepID=A2F409_TRIV3|nr:hypothetical protein TVAGG3_0227240 [Trichomonas vaginalis G3]EAY00363.1 hypothetical protein TVAG_407120 [Trichomonas vaginalis G3]KAI5552348.1 hypothetical protein TVAGG3_0227240 [Trichomonas vaginalis G3]|eukprot:XP_001313292.1 hypothetical protein [Trichomonas vaginalis G3]
MEIEQLNKLFSESNGIEEVAHRLTPELFVDIIRDFDSFPSKIQCSYLQTALFLNDEQFSNISNGYKKILDIASRSTDLWVQRLYEHFKNYPSLEKVDDFIMFPLEAQSYDEYQPFKFKSDPKPIENHIGPDPAFSTAPPSQYIKKPIAPEVPGVMPKPSYKQQSQKQMSISAFIPNHH